MEGRVFENFQKNQRNCKIPKMPKNVPKSIQTCFELVLCRIFRKNFLPSVPWRVESSKIFLKIKKFSKFQKCPKVFPKVSKHVLNMFWGNFFDKNFMPSVPWRVESSKIFKKIKEIAKFQKCPKTFPRVSKRVLNLFWVKLFENFFAQCSMEGRVFENFQNNQKICKIPKVPQIVLKSIQTCFELALGQIFRKFFLPTVPWRVEFSKIFKQNIFKIQNAQKCSQNYPNVF